MTYILINFIFALVGLGSFAILFLRNDGWRKYVGPTVFGGVCISSALFMALSLGSPVPQWLRLSTEKLKIVDIQFDTGKAIYIWGYEPGNSVPISIVLPWDITTAKNIAEQQAKAKSSGGTLMLNDPRSTDPVTLTQSPTPNKTE